MNSKLRYESAALMLGLANDAVDELVADRTDEVKSLMKNPENWIRNDYDKFIESAKSSRYPSYLSSTTAETLRKNGAETFQLRGFNIGFALVKDEEGKNIILVHNNQDDVHNILPDMLAVAKAHGGDRLDHFDGKLSELYEKCGFVEYKRFKWDNLLAPKGWDYAKFGRPDVILRRLEVKENTSRRRKRYKLLRKKSQKVS